MVREVAQSAARIGATLLILHILFFNRSYYPDTASTGQLLTELCEDLVKTHGCQVTVVCGPPLRAAEGRMYRSSGVVAGEDWIGVTILRATGITFDKNKFRCRTSIAVR